MTTSPVPQRDDDGIVAAIEHARAAAPHVNPALSDDGADIGSGGPSILRAVARQIYDDRTTIPVVISWFWVIAFPEKRPLWAHCLVLFAVAYRIAGLLPQPFGRPEFASRIVSALHALIVGVPSAYLWVNSGTAPDKISFLAAISTGYLVHDVIVITREANLRRLETYAHHAVFLFLLAQFADREPLLSVMGLATELSLVPLNLSWAMAKLQWKKSAVYVTVGGVSFLSFIMRVATYLAMLDILAKRDNPDPYEVGGLCALLVYNVYYLLVLGEKVREGLFSSHAPRVED